MEPNLDYEMLMLKARMIAGKPSSYLNDADIGHLMVDSRMKGLDGREILAKAWFMEKAPGRQLQNEPSSNAGDQVHYICKGCDKTFDSVTALNGHGEKRCIKKKELSLSK